MENSVFTYFNSLTNHEHISHLYYEDSESYEIATSFILNSTKCKNKCIYISDRPIAKELLYRLKGQGITKSVNSKADIFEEIIISNPVKESKKAQALVSKIESQIDKALKVESKTLRVVMINSDNYFLNNQDRLWMRAALNKICLEKPIILMSQFHIERLNSRDVLSIFKTHPTIVERNKVYKSPLYVKPETIIGELEKDSEKINELSSKEKKVLGLIINGLSNNGIANELSISIKTVETHRANIMKKLGIHNLVELVKFSMRNGLV